MSKGSKRHMGTGNQATSTSQGSRVGKKLFELPRRVGESVRDCGQRDSDSVESPRNCVRYLWASFKSNCPNGLSVDGWMNVVDEAASLGLDFIVFSVPTPLSENAGLWPVCKWAQETYDIVVGIHTSAAAITAADIEEIKKLDLSKTRIYVRKDEVDAIRYLTAEGIQIGAADPRGQGRANSAPCCDLPNRMLFVSERGVMYTCKYVENNDEFRMGHVEERPFMKVVEDANLPRVVPSSAPFISHGCDGCPPILIDDCP